MATFCIDWDDTLVDAKTQQWLDGAETALRHLHVTGHTLIVFTSRAGYASGRAQVEAQLARVGVTASVVAKPHADLYIDNRAFHFDGDWPEVIRLIHHGEYPKPRHRRRIAS